MKSINIGKSETTLKIEDFEQKILNAKALTAPTTKNILELLIEIADKQKEIYEILKKQR